MIYVDGIKTIETLKKKISQHQEAASRIGYCCLLYVRFQRPVPFEQQRNQSIIQRADLDASWCHCLPLHSPPVTSADFGFMAKPRNVVSNDLPL